MISFEKVTKSYMTDFGRKFIFKDLSFDIPEKESLGIIGYNGAGKSTLLRMISGVESADSGLIKRKSHFSWPIGFGGGFNGSLSGAENVKFVARIYGKDIQSTLEKTKDFAEIGEYFYLPVKTYSSGMKARLAFGLSLAIDFETYLIDEVIAVGDKRFKAKAREAFAKTIENKTVIMVSHSFKLLSEYAKNFGVLNKNELEIYTSLEKAQKRYDSL